MAELILWALWWTVDDNLATMFQSPAVGDAPWWVPLIVFFMAAFFFGSINRD